MKRYAGSDIPPYDMSSYDYDTDLLQNNPILDLSYPCPVSIEIEYETLTFKNAMAAYQAQKDVTRAKEFLDLGAKAAWKLGQTVKRPDAPYWGRVHKVAAMQKALRAKFSQNQGCMWALMETYGKPIYAVFSCDKYAPSGAFDPFWGVTPKDGKPGLNMLGYIMADIAYATLSNAPKLTFKDFQSILGDWQRLEVRQLGDDGTHAILYDARLPERSKKSPDMLFGESLPNLYESLNLNAMEIIRVEVRTAGDFPEWEDDHEHCNDFFCLSVTVI